MSTPNLNKFYDVLDEFSSTEEYEKFHFVIEEFEKIRQLRFKAEDMEEKLMIDEKFFFFVNKVSALSSEEQMNAGDHLKARLRQRQERAKLAEQAAINQSNRDELDKLKAESEEIANESLEDQVPAEEADASITHAHGSTRNLTPEEEEHNMEVWKEMQRKKKELLRAYRDDVPLLEVDH